MAQTIARPRFIIPALIAVLCALLIRAPWISSGLPFFYSEDEAHHFNRVAEMVKEGRWDPQYFHKPSLHFYLRMPVVAVAFLWNVREGHIRSVKEIRTRDGYGIAGYNFTASHPGIVKWNRALSVLLSVAAVFLTVMIAKEFAVSRAVALGAGLLVAISPEHVRNAAIIGVDTPMGFFALLATWLALLFRRHRRIAFLYGAAIASGFAVSSKYNALPIVLVPMLAAILAPSRSWTRALACLAITAASFFAASPYILSSLPLFLDQFAYEIWHYGVEGHAGHSAEPGLPQAQFYLHWMRTDAIGTFAALMLAVGAIGIVLRPRRRYLVGFGFGALFFLLMVSQKANFTRNVMVIVPWLALLCAMGVDAVTRMPFISQAMRGLLATLLWAAILAAPAFRLQTLQSQELSHAESRKPLITWMREQDGSRDIAVAGKLQLPVDVLRIPGVTVIDERVIDAVDLYLAGYEYVVVRSAFKGPLLESGLFGVVRGFVGAQEPQRIVDNPGITIFQALECSEECRARLLSRMPTLGCTVTGADGICRTAPAGAEPYEWITSRYARLTVRNSTASPVSNARLKVMSPWPRQSVRIAQGGSGALDLPPPGQWGELAVTFDSAITESSSREVVVVVSNISSPAERTESPDPRRLAIALSASP